MSAKALTEQIEKLTILGLTRLDKNIKLKDELLDLGDQYITAARVIDGLVEKYNDSNELFTGQLKSANDRITCLLAENALLKQRSMH